ncbi:hypothetical protein Tco_0017882 [Tanacetum coccineum]
MPKFSATPYDQAAKAEFKQKEILSKMMREFKSYEKYPTHKALYDALMLSLIQDEDDLDRVILVLRKRDRKEDEDPSTGSNQGKRKRSSGKDSEPSNTSLESKETYKGDTLPKSSKTGKSAFAEESVKEATHEVTMGEEEPVQENVNDADQLRDDSELQTDNAPKMNWFKKPPRPPTPDPLTFDELSGTQLNFACLQRSSQVDNITKVNLVGPVTSSYTGHCDRIPFDLSKPLPLKGHPGHLAVASEYFFNNDLEYLKSTDSERKYTTSILKMKAARFSKNDVYSLLKILSVIEEDAFCLSTPGFEEYWFPDKVFKGKIVGNYRFDETKEQKNETKGSESSLKNSTSCIMGEPLSPDCVFDFPIDKPEPQHAYDFFASGPLHGYAGNPDNMNEWIEVDVPVLGELGEPLGAEVMEMEEDLAMLFADDNFSDNGLDDDEDDEEV